jgi:MOSC domain-containing protein YiiM
MQVELLALLAGRVQPFARGETSAIRKTLLTGVVQIGFLGIVGDEQADHRYHGGADKALHHYPFDHYAHWQAVMPTHPDLSAPGSFGENISTWGLTEGDVCIGDRWRIGSALLEISQGRQPCWKQGVRMEWSGLTSRMVKENRSGWYYRVIEEGAAEVGSAMALVDRPNPDWTVARVFALLIAGHHAKDLAALRFLAEMSVLFEGWRVRAAELAASLRSGEP